MVHAKVVIQSQEDARSGRNSPLPEGTTKEGLIELNGELKFAVIQGGMANGATSVALSFRLPDGRYVWAETSAKIFEQMSGALRNAEARFASEADPTMKWKHP